MADILLLFLFLAACLVVAPCLLYAAGRTIAGYGSLLNRMPPFLTAVAWVITVILVAGMLEGL